MPIKMKGLRSFGSRGGPEGHVRRGREFTVATEARARELENAGHAYRLVVKVEPGSPPAKIESAPSNKAAEAGPLASAGGETGAAPPAPSSPPDRPQPGRRSRRSKGADLLS